MRIIAFITDYKHAANIMQSLGLQRFRAPPKVPPEISRVLPDYDLSYNPLSDDQ